MEKNENNNMNVGNIFTSPPIKIFSHDKEHDFYRADIIFYGVDHSGPSYEGRVFLNNNRANENTPMDEENGYAGSYYIFGHGGCFGDVGHCDLLPRRTYDSRAQHPLVGADKSIDATKMIQKALETTDEIIVTIVPIIAKGGRKSDIKDVIRMERIRMNMYENQYKRTKENTTEDGRTKKQ